MHFLPRAIAVIGILSASVAARPFFDLFSLFGIKPPPPPPDDPIAVVPLAPGCVIFTATLSAHSPPSLNGTLTVNGTTECTLADVFCMAEPECTDLPCDANREGMQCGQGEGSLVNAKMRINGFMKYQVEYEDGDWDGRVRTFEVNNMACESNPGEDVATCKTVVMSGSDNC